MWSSDATRLGVIKRPSQRVKVVDEQLAVILGEPNRPYDRARLATGHLPCVLPAGDGTEEVTVG
jgi:hypothetical protein